MGPRASVFSKVPQVLDRSPPLSCQMSLDGLIWSIVKVCLLLLLPQPIAQTQGAEGRNPSPPSEPQGTQRAWPPQGSCSCHTACTGLWIRSWDPGWP